MNYINIFRNDFPFYYDAIRGSYMEKADWLDSFRYSLMKAAVVNTTVNVSLTYMFTTEAFHSIGLQSKFGLSLLASYLTWVIQWPKIV